MDKSNVPACFEDRTGSRPNPAEIRLRGESVAMERLIEMIQSINRRKSGLSPWLGVLAVSAYAAGEASGVTLYTEDFGAGAEDRWTVRGFNEAGSTGSAAGLYGLPANSIFDFEIDFGYDYGSLLGLPSADGTSDTTGLFLKVNKTDQTGDDGETILAVADGQTFSGNYVLKFDAYFGRGGDPGTQTEYLTAGINAVTPPTVAGGTGIHYDGVDPVSQVQQTFYGGNGLGAGYGLTIDGGANNDLWTFPGGAANVVAYSPSGGTFSGDAGDYEDHLAPGVIPDWVTGVPSASGPDLVWHEMEIGQYNGDMFLVINGVLVHVYEGVTDTSGSIFLGLEDYFNSANPDNFVLYDNVVVETLDSAPNLTGRAFADIPEPASVGMLALGAAAVCSRRRR